MKLNVSNWYKLVEYPFNIYSENRGIDFIFYHNIKKFQIML